MASDWGQNLNLHFVASKGATYVETSSSGYRFRFFEASLSWLSYDALFASSFASLRVVVLLCWCRHVARFVVLLSSCRRVACFVVLRSSCRRVASFVVLLSSCRRVVSFVVSSIRRRLHKLVNGKSTFPANFAHLMITKWLQETKLFPFKRNNCKD